MRAHRFDFPDLPINAFLHIGDRRIKPHGPVSSAVETVSDVVGGAVESAGDVVGGALDTVSDVGSQVDDFSCYTVLSIERLNKRAARLGGCGRSFVFTLTSVSAPAASAHVGESPSLALALRSPAHG